MTDEYIAKRVAQLRAEKDVSARDMSLSLGQSESYINKIENQKALPSINGLYYICEYFGVTPSKFFDEGNKTPEMLREAVAQMKSLNSRQLGVVLALLRELNNK